MATRKPATPTEVIVTFEYERETKNTYRFAESVEEDGEPIVGTLYVKKSALGVVTEETVLTVTIAVG